MVPHDIEEPGCPRALEHKDGAQESAILDDGIHKLPGKTTRLVFRTNTSLIRSTNQEQLYQGTFELEGTRGMERWREGIGAGDLYLLESCLDFGSPEKPGETVLESMVLYGRGVELCGITSFEPSQQAPSVCVLFRNGIDESLHGGRSSVASLVPDFVPGSVRHCLKLELTMYDPAGR